MNPDTLQNRPPLYSIPSSHSLRSHNTPSLDDPEIDRFISERSKTNFNTYDYCKYYLPVLSWLPEYTSSSLLGDALAGISLASFQIPLVMSFATSLAHMPPVTGLYSVIAGACIYAVFGSVPVLVVGASPATALIFGQAIDQVRSHPNFANFSPLQVSSAISCLMGAILLGCGLCRFGFLDNVLSRALLKGFIAAMGIIMIVNELAVEMGLPKNNAKTCIQKLIYAVSHIPDIHRLTFTISSVTLIIVLTIRFWKAKVIHRYKNVVYIPELLLMVAITTIACYHYKWDVEIVGDASNTDGGVQIVNPFDLSKFELYKNVFSTAFLCTILGYFDSTTASKALGAQYNYPVSSNKELIALGVTNFALSLTSGLPAFGAFGRSRINMMAGATTPLAGVIMSIATGFAIVYLLPALYYLPECVLALTTTIIGITVLQEVPQDILFFWRIRGYDELTTFGVVFLATIIWSPTAGVSLGTLIAVVRVIRHSTHSNIQVLGRVPNTNVFRNADEIIEEMFHHTTATDSEPVNEPAPFRDNHETSQTLHNKASPAPSVAQIEYLEKVLVVKIPEALNFANVDSLKSKLERIERFGSLSIHPSQKHHYRDFTMIRAVVIDCKGMTAMDSSATQVLYEIVNRYTERNIIVCFSRLSLDLDIREKFRRSGIVDLVNTCFSGRQLGSSRLGDGFFLSIDSALRGISI